MPTFKAEKFLISKKIFFYTFIALLTTAKILKILKRAIIESLWQKLKMRNKTQNSIANSVLFNYFQTLHAEKKKLYLLN